MSTLGAAAPAPTFSFGATAPSPAPAAGGFTFGASSNTPAPSAAPAAFSFGATPAPAPGATASTTSAFGFGATPAPASAATPAFGSTFGVKPAAPGTSGGIFGAAPAPAPAGGILGSFGKAPAPGPFGTPASGGFGLSGSTTGAAAAGATVAAAGAGPAQYVSPDTRYEDLPEAFRKGIDALAAEIKRQRGLADEVSRTNPAHGLELQAEMRRLRRSLLDLGNEQGTQKLALEELKGDADRTRKQAEVHGTFLVQRMHSHSGLNTVEQLPSDYLWELVESFERRFTKYVQEINAIKEQLSDKTLQGVDAPAGTIAPYGQRARVTPERLAVVIREQWKTFNQVAGQAAVTHERIELLRERYKEHFKDDPFEAAERQERAAQRRLEKQMRDQVPRPSAPAPSATPAAPTASAPAFGTVFGTQTASTTPFGQAAAPAPSTGIFGTPAPGGALSTPAPAPSAFGAAAAPATGIFGTNPAPAASTGTGFGSLAAPAAAAPAPGIFGAAAPAPAAGAFGTTPAPAPGGLGGALFGRPAPAAGGSSVRFGPTTTLGSTSRPSNSGKKKNKPRSRHY